MQQRIFRRTAQFDTSRRIIARAVIVAAHEAFEISPVGQRAGDQHGGHALDQQRPAILPGQKGIL